MPRAKEISQFCYKEKKGRKTLTSSTCSNHCCPRPHKKTKSWLEFCQCHKNIKFLYVIVFFDTSSIVWISTWCSHNELVLVSFPQEKKIPIWVGLGMFHPLCKSSQSWPNTVHCRWEQRRQQSDIIDYRTTPVSFKKSTTKLKCTKKGNLILLYECYLLAMLGRVLYPIEGIGFIIVVSLFIHCNRERGKRK